MSDQKILLRGKHGDVWIDCGPKGDHIEVETRTEYRATGEVIHDSKWGEVRVFEELTCMESIRGSRDE